MEPHDYRIFYVNIDSRHQYGISVAESQLFVRVKHPQQRRARMFSQARVHTYSSPWFFHTFSVIRQCQNYRKCMETLRFSKNWSGTSLLSRFSVLFLWTHKLGKVCFLLGGGVGQEGRVLSKFFTNWGGSNPFYSQLGESHSFFGKEKILPCRSILYIQAKLPVKINRNYVQVSKNLYIKKLSSPN